ncbi:membrane spanning protein [Staphylococcus agnetis]|uniref:PH domain-containing protein n=1 Tax=Staphylococcus agnetis TaxID=985762 RepID=UPI000E037773|nr:PH domain-containing protein [Staphylococcus agnetis]SUK12336.1 membrane spanning protein [Staphylococcus agnetis]
MKTMHKQGLKVMYIKGMLYSCLVIVLASGYIATAYLLKWESLKVFLIISITITLLAMVYLIVFAPKYRFIIFKYNYDANKIYIQKGLVFLKQTHVPLYRIQNVEIEEGWIMRRYHLANILMHTAGGLVSVKLIHKDEAQKLNAFIRQHGMIDESGASHQGLEANTSDE